MSNITQLMESHALEKIFEVMADHHFSRDYVAGMIYMFMQLSQNIRFLQIYMELMEMLAGIQWRF